MSEVSQDTPCIPLENHPHPHKKIRLPAFLDKSITWIPQNPIMGSLVLTVSFFLVLAMVVGLTFNRDARFVVDQVPCDSDGVSSPLPSDLLSCFRTETLCQIAVIGHSYRLDLDRQALSVQWEIVGCGAYRLPTYNSPRDYYSSSRYGASNRAVDVYLNEWVIAHSPNPRQSH